MGICYWLFMARFIIIITAFLQRGELQHKTKPNNKYLKKKKKKIGARELCYLIAFDGFTWRELRRPERRKSWGGRGAVKIQLIYETKKARICFSVCLRFMAICE